MKAMVFSLILALSPTVALSDKASTGLDPRTQEILERRTCQYLKSDFTLRETIRAITYHVNENMILPRGVGTSLGAELNNIMVDYIVRDNAEKIIENAIKARCRKFLNLL
jgi:hypothetical protein